MTNEGIAATQQFYTRWARLYDAVAARTPGIGHLRERAVAALAPRVGDTVLDLGCGTGANFRYLRERVGLEGTVVGVDFTPGMLTQARRRIERAGWRNVLVVRGDAARPPVREADAAFASFVSGMLEDPAGAVGEWAQLVGPGGRLGLLDLTSSVGASRPLNALFRALVAVSSPRGTSSRYVDSPTRVLDRRVSAAHRALSGVSGEVTSESRALGFVRVSAGRVR
ncbi:MAG: class I SAM-dependent methyltransferase [Salinigranum sp.]